MKKLIFISSLFLCSCITENTSVSFINSNDNTCEVLVCAKEYNPFKKIIYFKLIRVNINSADSAKFTMQNEMHQSVEIYKKLKE
jgi:hypothetical protein